MRSQATIGLLVAGAAIAALAFSAQARAIDPSTGLEDVPDAPDPSVDPNAPSESSTTPTPTGDPMTDFASVDPDQRLRAFIYMIRSCEHRASDVASGADYTTFYGGSTFHDLSDHPVLTGEKVGVPLDNLGPAYAGKVSTAAGGLQITVTTWAGNRLADGSFSGGVRDAGSWGPRLEDFTPASQDEAGRRILSQCGALAYIESGDLWSAIRMASRRWASLPGSTAGQGGRTMDFALARIAEGYGLA